MKLDIFSINGVKCSGQISLDDLLKLPTSVNVEVYTEPLHDIPSLESLKLDAEMWAEMCKAHGIEPGYTYLDLLEDRLEYLNTLAKIGLVNYEEHDAVIETFAAEYLKC